MAYLNVDIDLDDLDTAELVSELVRRLKHYRESKRLSPDQINSIKTEFSGLVSGLNLSSFNDLFIPTDSLEDRLKIEYLAKVWDKFTSWELEELLNRKISPSSPSKEQLALPLNS